MPVPDPEGEGADERRHPRRGRLAAQRDGVDPERLEIVERRASGRPAVQLLGNVTLQVAHEPHGHGILCCQLPRTLQRHLHQRHHREGHVGARGKKARRELARVGIVEQQLSRRRECRRGQIELAPKTGTGRRHDRLRRP